MKKLLILILLSLGLSVNSSTDTIVYITDRLEIPIRSDKSFGENIIRLLPSGTELSLIQITDDGAWAQIKYKDSVGWIAAYYLSTDLPARKEVRKLKAEIELLKKQVAFLEIRRQALAKLKDSGVNSQDKVKEAEILAQEVAKQVKRAEEKRKAEEEKAKLAIKEKEEAQRLAEEERIRLDELEAERAAQQLAFEKEQYNRLLTQEVQAEQDQERLLVIEDQLNILKSSYVGNIAARVKSFWRYQRAEADWTAEVYVVQDRDGNVVAVDIRNSNAGNSANAQAFKDSIRRAVYKASPLPAAPDEAVYDNELIFLFRVN